MPAALLLGATPVPCPRDAVSGDRGISDTKSDGFWSFGAEGCIGGKERYCGGQGAKEGRVVGELSWGVRRGGGGCSCWIWLCLC